MKIIGADDAGWPMCEYETVAGEGFLRMLANFGELMGTINSYCCKSLFAAWDSNSPSRRRDDRIIMWGTTPPCAKLTGDSGSGFEAASIGDCRLFRLSAEN